MSVTQKDLIRKSAIFFRDKTAMVCGDASLTFSEVDEGANRLANALCSLGLVPGARVVTLMRNCLQYVEVMFGLIKGAFPQVTLNPRLPTAELAFQINETEASAIVVQHHYADIIASIRDQLTAVRHVICFDGTWPGMLSYEELLASADSTEPEVELNLGDLGEIQYSGGTTGRPKGIMLPFANKLGVTRNILLDKVPDMSDKDRFMALQPLYHGAGWFILPAWVRGATQYMIDTFTGDVALEAIERYKITVIKTIPTVLLRLLDSPDIRKRDLSSIRTIVYGAEPMSVQRLKEAIAFFGPVFVQGYGQMEAAASISHLTKEDHVIDDNHEISERLKSVGRPLTFVDVRVVDEAGKDVPPGEFGEVIVRGDHIMIGYLNRPEETAAKKRNGWIFTGDLGKIDRDGYIYLTGGRKSEMIISGGLNIYPIEVEQVLTQHHAVARAAVIGVLDPQWGESVKACVILKKGQSVSEQELIDFCKERMASYKKPRSVEVMSQLPLTATGKVSYAELRKMFRK